MKLGTSLSICNTYVRTITAVVNNTEMISQEREETNFSIVCTYIKPVWFVDWMKWMKEQRSLINLIIIMKDLP